MDNVENSTEAYFKVLLSKYFKLQHTQFRR